jgi:hypothetical protein
MANAPVIAPVTTDTNPACEGEGSGKVINHSTTRQLINVMIAIINLGRIFHFKNVSTVMLHTPCQKTNQQQDYSSCRSNQNALNAFDTQDCFFPAFCAHCFMRVEFCFD